MVFSHTSTFIIKLKNKKPPPNGEGFYDRLQVSLAQTKRAEKMLAVMFLDLDGFKQINDKLGHIAGDKFLQVIAERLKGCVRKGDTVSRFGGDEFTLLFTGISKPKDIEPIAIKILQNIEKPWVFNNQEFTVTASAGIAIYPKDAENVEDLMKYADRTIYQVKEKGKNMYRFFDFQSI